MLRSLFSGITGLRAHQTQMDVVANNISNVNTTGFKSSSAIFEDTLSQVMRTPTAPNASLGGMNPAQVGLGVQLAAIQTNFGQGSAQTTGRATDLMIQGDGFFLVKNGLQMNYTRAGAFNFDSNGALVNADGMRVQGWMPDPTTGAINTAGTPVDIVIPAGKTSPPVASTTVTAGGNIPPGGTDTLTLSATVYDKTGGRHDLSIVLTPNSGSYDVAVTDNTDSAGSSGTAGTIAFAAGGAYDDTASTPASITTADGTVINIDLTRTTAYGGPKSFAVSKTDGYPSGTLQQFQINIDGTITGVFSNSAKLPIGIIALANFNNPNGLSKVGSTSWTTTSNSGLPNIGQPGSSGTGQLLANAIEMSNVDLGQEFTSMIVAQRGFQANSRVITTSDSMLQDLVDLKR